MTLTFIVVLISFVAGLVVAHETNSIALGGVASLHFWYLLRVLRDVHK